MRLREYCAEVLSKMQEIGRSNAGEMPLIDLVIPYQLNWSVHRAAEALLALTRDYRTLVIQSIRRERGEAVESRCPACRTVNSVLSSHYRCIGCALCVQDLKLLHTCPRCNGVADGVDDGVKCLRCAASFGSFKELAHG